MHSKLFFNGSKEQHLNNQIILYSQVVNNSLDRMRKNETENELRKMSYEERTKICEKYIKGIDTDLSPTAKAFLDDKAGKCLKIYMDFIKMADKYGLKRVDLW